MADQASGMNFREHLRRQVGFLERSCASYDASHVDEAIRMAVVLRVLFHDTRDSISLLAHLNARSITIIDTRMALWPNAVQYQGMGTHMFHADGATLVPHLGNIPPPAAFPVDEWWLQPVVVLDGSTRMSRRDIVLTAADKDGGAHVDEKLTPEYERLATDGAFGRYYGTIGGTRFDQPVVDVHLVCIRQMAYEVLHSPDLRELAE